MIKPDDVNKLDSLDKYLVRNASLIIDEKLNDQYSTKLYQESITGTISGSVFGGTIVGVNEIKFNEMTLSAQRKLVEEYGKYWDVLVNVPPDSIRRDLVFIAKPKDEWPSGGTS